jgi:hypothetical protein
MGLKGYRLWVMGQLDLIPTCRASPTEVVAEQVDDHEVLRAVLDALGQPLRLRLGLALGFRV